jgi:hypothetical protein
LRVLAVIAATPFWSVCTDWPSGICAAAASRLAVLLDNASFRCVSEVPPLFRRPLYL